MQLTTFKQLKGKPEWVASQQQKMRDSVIRFSPNGRFRYTTSNVRSDLFPVSGQFSDSTNRIGFTGHNTAVNSVSVNFVDVVGSIERANGRYVMRLAIASGTGMGAVVNDQKFGSTSSSHYEAMMIVAPN